MRMLCTLVCCWLLGLTPLAAEALIRLDPLPENPPQETDSGSMTWARMHQVGGIDGNVALVFLPIAAEYVSVLRDARAMEPEQLSRIGPWPSSFLIQFNAYGYANENPDNLTELYEHAKAVLRWGQPSADDSAVLPEPVEVTPLTPRLTSSGIWYLADFGDAKTAQAFLASGLWQLRLTINQSTFVIDLGEWSDVTLFGSGEALVGPPVLTPGPDSEAEFAP